jgi:manganese efflux pump family protein
MIVSATLFFTAVGLAMDAVAVSIASGISAKQVRVRDAFSMAFAFGVFQGIMPVAGFWLGLWLAEWLAAYDHWIAFVLLSVLGVKMIREAREVGEERIHAPFRFNKIMVLAVATSIDAFAVGVSFSLLEQSLLMTAFTIGIITFALCLPAVWFGARLGKLFAKRAEVFGGGVLIAIGCKILIEHLILGI